MCRYRNSLTAAALASLSAAVMTSNASAAELIYGNWTPAQEYQNRVVMPEMFKNIEQETNGAIKWKLIAGRPARRRQDHLHRGQGRPDAGGARHRHLRAERDAVGLRDLLDRRSSARTIRWRRRGAALETIYLHCPSCLEEAKKIQCRAARRLDQLGLCAGLPRRRSRRSPTSRASASAPPAAMPRCSRWPAWCRSAPRWSRRSACCSAAVSIASTASPTGCAPSATPTSPSTSWTIRSA